MTLDLIDRLVNWLIIPAIGYIIWIERRMTRIETVLFNHFGIVKKKKK